MMNDEITLIVPTHNRPHFLRRLLHFLDQRDFKSSIFITDSSRDEMAHDNDTLVALYRSRLSIRYQHTNVSFGAKCIYAIDAVKTPFTVFCADDDFLMPDSAQRCVEFLKQHADYNCAAGIWVQVEANRDNRCSQIRCDQIDDTDATRRFQKLAKNWFSNFYSVYRTETLARAWRVAGNASDYDNARIFLELMLCHLGAIYGKMAVLPQPHYLFELHGENDSSHLPLIANGDRANELYDSFENALATELSAVGGGSVADATRTIRKCYGHWRTGESIRSNHRPTGLRKYARKLRQSVAKIRDGISNNPTKVWTKRRLDPGHDRLQTDAWQFAMELTRQFPHGMTAEQLKNASSRASLRTAA